VDYAGGVDGDQAFCQPRPQPQHFIDRQRSVTVYRLGQRRSGDIVGSQPRHRAVRVRIDHPRGKSAAHLPRRGDLLPEPGPEYVIRGQVGADDLYCDRSPVLGQTKEYLSHAAAAQPPGQAVPPDRARVVRPQGRYHPDSHSKRQVNCLTAVLGSAI
jgi:hypothetical protein